MTFGWGWLAAGLTAGVLLLGAGGCGSKDPAAPAGQGAAQGSGAKGGGAGAAGKNRRAYPVRTAQIVARPVDYTVNAVGNVEAQDIYQIHARVPGTLYDIEFNEGSEIKKDFVLCRIAPEAYRFKAQKQEALYNQAVATLADRQRVLANEIERKRIDLDRASLEVARRRAVKEAGAISDEEIQLFQSRRDLAALELKDAQEAAKTELKALEAAIVEREADWRIAQDDVNKSIVRSPVEGTIERRFVTNGMFVQAGQQLATLVDRRSLRVRFRVNETESAVVKAGDPIVFTVPAYPARTFKGEVYYVGSKLEDDNRVVLCHARVTEDAELLKPGYFASVQIVARRNNQAIVVPRLAVQPTERGFVSFVVKDGKAEKRLVTVGQTLSGTEIEILDGLNAGEILVVDGANALAPGFAVVVREGPGAEAPAAENLPVQGVKTADRAKAGGVQGESGK